MNKIKTIIRLAWYFVIFMKEMIKANIEIAYLVLKPGKNFKSFAVRFKSKMKTKAELVLITNSITLTPGTLVMDANLESGEILVHSMAGDSLTSVCSDLSKFPEEKVLHATRGEK